MIVEPLHNNETVSKTLPVNGRKIFQSMPTCLEIKIISGQL